MADAICSAEEAATQMNALNQLYNVDVSTYTLLTHFLHANSGQEVLVDRLAHGRPDFRASSSEWRTPPLWGIGLSEVVNGHSTFLHDGRARNLTEAILWHGGEARASADAVGRMSTADRARLLAFIKSL